ncbi:MAG: phosphoglucomutase/phosphomannomutase family protein [Candidatus Omnitrophica bacterium]|nr:phosphoglucomutase/phosphomannomutase family protein [Candidatus Omnitrophota bacterium]
MSTIRFGTSGWRAIIAEEFTFDRLSLVVQAIANTLRKEGSLSKGIVVGYDTRFLSREFAEEAARVLSANKIPVFLSRRDVPTPCISFNILHRKTLGGINISASHNPAEYGGIKFSPAHGGPAGVEVTHKIEEEIQALVSPDGKERAKEGKPAKIHPIDPAPPYLRHLASMLHVQELRKARLQVVVDCFNGTSRGYLDRFLRPYAGGLHLLRTTLDPTFGGRRPDPAGENLSGLIREVRKRRAHVGLATDGDADRFGIIDRGGHFIPPNDVISLVLEYLIETRPRATYVARSLATTHRVDLIAKHHGMEVVETPVGFKYIGEILSKGNCLLGAEESAGFSIQHHLPEKDGILATLLVAEMVACRRKSLREMLKALDKTYGPFYSTRIDLALAESSKRNLLRQLEEGAPGRLGKVKVLKCGRRDGFKFYLEKESWVLLRPSGTEPLLRVYLEARSRKDLVHLKMATERLIRKSSL